MASVTNWVENAAKEIAQDCAVDCDNNRDTLEAIIRKHCPFVPGVAYTPADPTDWKSRAELAEFTLQQLRRELTPLAVEAAPTRLGNAVGIALSRSWGKDSAFCKINLNNHILVKLRDVGLARHRELHDQLNSMIPQKASSYVPPKTDADGYTVFHLWEFIEYYGDLISMGSPVPCETEILVKPFT